MKRPSIVGNAVKSINKARINSLVDHKEKISRSNLVTLTNLAINEGIINTAKGCLSDGRVLTFVDLDTFPQEFDQFIMSVTKHKLKITKSDVLCAITKARFEPKNLKRLIIQWITSYPWCLRWLERFCTSPSDFIRLANKTTFSASQIVEEINGLLSLLAKTRPRNVLEIGSEKGGTLYLFTKVADATATLVSADLKIANQKLFSSFARNKQRVYPMQGNSQEAVTIEAIRKRFPAGVDFLFLDGDHSYDGVKKDFQNYSPLVNEGGLIAFHDIVEDNDTRFGVVTGGWSGGVPRFWQEIKTHYRYVEFIQSSDQDGLGIGVIFVDKSIVPDT